MREALVDVRRRLVERMREDPPFRLVPGGDGPVLERWMTRLSPDELGALERLERLFGGNALAELFAEALLEAGIVRPSFN